MRIFGGAVSQSLGGLALGIGACAVETFNYYVDATNGNDSNSGTYALPWKTLAKVNASSFSAGDKIGLKRGESWPETLTVPSSGSAGNPITFGAWGGGPNPIINGGGVRAQCVQASNRDYIIIQDITCQNAAADSIMVAGTADHFTLRRVTVTGGLTGITITAVDSEILNCTFSGQSLVGIYGHQDAARLHVASCEISGTNDHGLKLMFDNGIVEWNNIHHNRYNGIYIEGVPASGVSADGNIVRYNWCHENGQNITDLSNGAEIYNSGGDNNEYYYNLLGPGGPDESTVGFWLDYGSSGCKFYNNTIVHMRGTTQGRGYKLEDGPAGGATQNNIMKNNIVADCYQEVLEVYDTIDAGTNELQGNVIDYNLYFRGANPDLTHGLIYDGRPSTRGYKTLAQWQGSAGTPDANSIEGDPLFMDAANNDYRLQAGSPANEAGTDLGATYAIARNGIQGALWDIGAYVV